MNKKDYYKKKHGDCPCCGWQGHVNYNMRAWLGHRERLSEKEVSDYLCDSPIQTTKGLEIGRNDLSTQKCGVTVC